MTRTMTWYRRLPRGAIEIALIVVALTVYGFLRVRAEGSYADASSNARLILDLERRLGIDWERGAQAWVLDKPFWISVWNFIYQYLYWATVGTILVVLWFRDRSRYHLLRNTLLTAAAIGLMIWSVFPVAPPRFMGYVDTLSFAGDRVLDEQPGMINRYAAVPSFHSTWPALAGFVLAMKSRRPVVWFGAMLPSVLLTLAVVFTGNHFILDVVAGLAVVTVAFAITSGLRIGSGSRAFAWAGAPSPPDIVGEPFAPDRPGAGGSESAAERPSGRGHGRDRPGASP